MLKTYLKIFGLSLTLIGCASTGKTYLKPPINKSSDDASIKLAEAAESISDSMMEVAKVEKVINPQKKDNNLIVNAPGLQAHASVDWSGPIDEITLKIARSANYRTRFIGKAPAIPILVSVRSEDKTLGEILRDLDYQAGNKADIHVYPNSRVVELRYAKMSS